MEKKNDNISKRGWLEFREAGLLFLVNQFLHIFGWCIVFCYNSEIKEIEPTQVYVGRTKYRGFGEEAQDQGYTAITEYMFKNSKELLHEVSE